MSHTEATIYDNTFHTYSIRQSTYDYTNGYSSILLYAIATNKVKK